MASKTIVYWRDIPAQVIVKAGRKSARRELPQRFQEAIDIAAMRGKAHETDDYLAEWRRGEPAACGDDLETEADTLTAALEADYDEARLKALMNKGGRESG